MDEIIQSLEAKATNGSDNFCEIDEKMLLAKKELSKRREEKRKEAIEFIENHLRFNCDMNCGDMQVLLDILKEVE